MPDYLWQGLFALLAVALGAAGSFTATQAMDRKRWVRQQETRWDEHRLRACIEYATAVKLAIIRSRSILGHMGLSPTLTPLSPEEGLPLLAVDENSRTAKLEALMLLASEETIETAREWHGIAWRFHHWASGEVPTSEAEVEAAYEQAQVARERYYSAVRRELGINPAPDGRRVLST